MGWDGVEWGGMGRGESRAPLEVLILQTQGTLTSPKSRAFHCQAKTIVSFLEMLLRNSRRLHLLCTGMFPREI